MNSETRIIDLTVSELQDIITSTVSECLNRHTPVQDEELHGLREIARFLNVTKATVCTMRKQGRLKGAITQNGRVIITTKQKLLKALKQ